MRKPVKALALAAMLSAGTVLIHPAPALAAAYSPATVCAKESGRGGWSHVKDNKRAVKNGKSVWGHVWLMWNGALRKNCVAVIKSAFVGTPTFTQAILHVKGGAAYRDPGKLTARKYKYYAAAIGYGKGKCVAFEGYISDTRADYGVAHGKRGKWGNCG